MQEVLRLPIKPISKLQVDDFGSSKDQLQLPEQEESEELVESYQDEAKPDINVTDEEMEEEVTNTNIEEESLSKIQTNNFGTAEPKIEISVLNLYLNQKINQSLFRKEKMNLLRK